MKAKDVKRIRAKLELSQSEFAKLLGVSVRTLQDWEQGRNSPGAPAVALLKLAASGMMKENESMNTEISRTQLMRKLQRRIGQLDGLKRTYDLMRRDDLDPAERKELTKLQRSFFRSTRAGR
jgi:transcriptional regulator with XRE-family HTH domain